MLISSWLKEVTFKDKLSLKRTMDDISYKAEKRGITTEILESILSEEK